MNNLKIEKYIQNIKNKKCSKTLNGSIVNDLDKIIFLWSPRAGCSITCSCAFDILSLMEDSIEFNGNVHGYRLNVYLKNVIEKNIVDLYKQNYTIIKSIVNPYSRAVSIYLFQRSHNLSFREFLKKLLNNTLEYNEFDNYHLQQQYIDKEESYITKYIKLDLFETYNFVLNNGENYLIDINKYSSKHHFNRKDINFFLGDMPLKEAKKNIPKLYSFFYDDEIKNMVEQYYSIDIKKYNYKFEDIDNHVKKKDNIEKNINE
jgi:hypothetical protein